jgi:GR25 family glycosyltransferase involved in LPS biosynthesis
MYQIVDNFLNYNDFIEIKNLLLSKNFPWYYGVVVEDDAIVEDQLGDAYNFQFTHVFYNNFLSNGEYYFKLEKLLTKINPKSLLRIKANLSPRTDKIVEYGYHIDFPDVISCIFYINTNNGYTKFKTGEIVDSVENRIVFFDSNHLHTGSSCTDQDRRIAINLNFVPS